MCLVRGCCAFVGWGEKRETVKWVDKERGNDMWNIYDHRWESNLRSLLNCRHGLPLTHRNRAVVCGRGNLLGYQLLSCFP